MKCTKAAYEQCAYNAKCWPGIPISPDSDCAEYNAAIMAHEEKKESENDGKSNDAC